MAGYISNIKDSFQNLSVGKQVAVGVMGLYCADRLTRAVIRKSTQSRLRRKRKEYQEWCKGTIKVVQDSIIGDQRIESLKDEVTKLPAAEIVARIKNGQLKVIDVLKCFQAKALEAHAATNCISHFYLEAIDQAKSLDKQQDKDMRKETLYGIPISLKDHIAVKGYASSSGVANKLDAIFEDDSVLVQVFKEEGAIPFVRTNVPQLMLSFESNNPIFGTVSNPHDPNRGPGGSSSGEGAIVGYGASVIGLGSDIGGSIRVPAAFCGCYGMKPTVERMSKRGMPRGTYGQTLVEATFGPLTQDLDSLILAMKVIWNGAMSNIDRKMLPTQYQDQIVSDTRPLRIGYYIDNGTITPVPAVHRAVMMAKKALEQRGHTLVQWKPPHVQEIMGSMLQLMQADGGKTFVDIVGEDDLSYAIQTFIGSLKQPTWKRKFDVFLAGLYKTKQEVNLAKARLGVGSAYNWFKAVENMLDLRDKFDDAWRSSKLDVVLAPSWFSPALPLVKTGNMSTEALYLGLPNILLTGATMSDTISVMGGCSYTAVYNGLNLPAGVMPVTTVTEEDVRNMAAYPRKDKLHEAVVEGQKSSEGLPIAVQIIVPRFQDEYILRVMKEIQSGLS